MHNTQDIENFFISKNSFLDSFFKKGSFILNHQNHFPAECAKQNCLRQIQKNKQHKTKDDEHKPVAFTASKAGKVAVDFLQHNEIHNHGKKREKLARQNDEKRAEK